MMVTAGSEKPPTEIETEEKMAADADTLATEMEIELMAATGDVKPAGGDGRQVVDSGMMTGFSSGSLEFGSVETGADGDESKGSRRQQQGNSATATAGARSSDHDHKDDGKPE